MILDLEPQELKPVLPEFLESGADLYDQTPFREAIEKVAKSYQDVLERVVTGENSQKSLTNPERAGIKLQKGESLTSEMVLGSSPNNYRPKRCQNE